MKILGKQNRLMAGYPLMFVDGLEKIIKRAETEYLRSIGAEPLSAREMAIAIPQIFDTVLDFDKQMNSEDTIIAFPLSEELVVLKNHPYKNFKKIAEDGKLKPNIGPGKIKREEFVNSVWEKFRNPMELIVSKGPIYYNYDKLSNNTIDDLNLDEYGLNLPKDLKKWYGRKWNTSLSNYTINNWSHVWDGYNYDYMNFKTFPHLNNKTAPYYNIEALINIETDKLGSLKYFWRLNSIQKEFAWLFKDQTKNLAEFLKDIGIKKIKPLLSPYDVNSQHSYVEPIVLYIDSHKECATLLYIPFAQVYGALSFSDFIKRGGKEFVFKGQKYKISKRRTK